MTEALHHRELESAEPLGFANKLEARQRAVNSLLCVGLDPDISKIPASFKAGIITSCMVREKMSGIKKRLDRLGEEEAGKFMTSIIIEEFNKRIIDETHQYVSAFKPNIAFYARYGEFGIRALKNTIKYIREVDPTISIILDAKRADIGATNEGYADELCDIDADAMTVNPYFGIEGKGALDPILNLKGKGVIILCRTSNLEAGEIQDLIVKHEEYGEVPLWKVIAHMAEIARQKNPNVAIVMGATNPEQLKEVREIFKGNMLVPGLGKQGGKPEDLVDTFDENGLGIIANNSSGIIHVSQEENFAVVAGQKAREWRDEINAVRQAA
ncbi:orotidine-5'-phosphate decarboxylase [Patescibacteria group bacterium]|nr:orotidine-5'-phosphate decarboxylase [Patescibacteria group bacterium]